MRNYRPIDSDTRWKLRYENKIDNFFVIFLFIIPMCAFLFRLPAYFRVAQDIKPKHYYETIKDGRHTFGTIDTVFMDEAFRANWEDNVQVLFTYPVDSSIKHVTMIAPENSRARKLRRGMKVSVHHTEEWAVITGVKPYQYPWVKKLLKPFLISFIGMWFIYKIWRRSSEKADLYEFGEIVEARLIRTEVFEGYSDLKINARLIVTYRYYDSQKRDNYGVTKTEDFEFAEKYRKGHKFKILVSQIDETKSIVYPRLVAKENNWPSIEYKAKTTIWTR